MENQMPVTPPEQKKSNATIYIIIGAALIVCCIVAVIGIAAFGLLAGSTPTTTTAPAETTSEPIQTDAAYTGLADQQLRTDTMALLEQYETSQGCDDVKFAGGTVVDAPSKASDPWTESWEITACNNSTLFNITFTPSPAGGTDIHITGGQ